MNGRTHDLCSSLLVISGIIGIKKRQKCG